MRSLYICNTYYHTLITLVKSLAANEKFDMLLYDNIPMFTELHQRLESTGLFDTIHVYKCALARERESNRKNLTYFLTDRKRVRDNVSKCCGVDFRNYDDLYIFQDAGDAGKYLFMNDIRYHLIEDALDYFKYFDEYWGIGMGSYRRGTPKFFLKEHFGIGYLQWGQSSACIDIEVNDLKGLKIPRDKCFALPRKELFNRLTPSQKELVYEVYAGGKDIGSSQTGSVLLMTQPLLKDGLVQSEVEQMAVFEALVRSYSRNGQTVTIKPHPRDELDYSRLADAYGCAIIDAQIPSEVMNFNPKASFDVAISITSTSVNFLEHVSQRKILGRDYIDEIVGR